MTDDVTDPMEVFVTEQRKTVRIEEEEARNRKLASIGGGGIFPAGVIILQDEQGHRTMPDEAGNQIAMTQSREPLELDEPERSHIVAVDRHGDDATVS